MKATAILYPIDVDEKAHNQLKQLKETWKNIKEKLNDMKGKDITFDQLLLNLNASEETYLLAIRSSLNSPTIFLKRQPNELRVNNYTVLALVHGELTWTFNLFLMFMHVQCILSLTSQKPKKASVRFCELLVMKPEKEMLVLSNKSEI